MPEPVKMEEILKVQDPSERSEKIAELAKEEFAKKKEDPSYKMPTLEDSKKSADKKEEVKEEEKPVEKKEKEESKEEVVDDTGADKQDKDKASVDEDSKQSEEVIKDSGKESKEESKDSEQQKSSKESIAKVEEIKNYAFEHNMSEEDASKELESIRKIRDKYADDPFKMAKSALYLQRMASQAQQEISRLTAPQDGFHNDGAIIQGQKISREEIVADTKLMYPARTESMDDEQVYDLAREIYDTKIRTVLEVQQQQMPKMALEKRNTSISLVPEKDKRFLPEVKKMVEAMDDRTILHPSFNVKNTLDWVKGRYYDKDMEVVKKKAYDEGFRKGQESSKILGEKTDTANGANPGTNKTKPSTLLSERERNEALQMFSTNNVSDEKKYELYMDVKERTKNKKEKVK